jgi:hypothetical protein
MPAVAPADVVTGATAFHLLVGRTRYLAAPW